MKKLLLILFLKIFSISVFAGIWIFPVNSYYQWFPTSDYNFNNNFFSIFQGVNYNYPDGRQLPCYVIDDQIIYGFKDSPKYFLKEKIAVNNFGFPEYVTPQKTYCFIIGGGYLADNIQVKTYSLPDNQDCLLDAACEYWRNQILREGNYFKDYNWYDKNGVPLFKEDINYNWVLDYTFFIPNIVKSVKMNVPFYDETIKGKHIIYDDDILKLRWFIKCWPRGTNRVQYINCTKPMVEGSPGNGVGVELDVEFHIPSDNIVILNGYADWNKQHLYKQNARMKKVRVEGEGFSLEYEFEDYVHFAQIDFPKQADKVKITVLEVYDGSKWADMAISGIWVNPDVTKTADSKIAQEYLEYAKQHCVEVE